MMLIYSKLLEEGMMFVWHEVTRYNYSVPPKKVTWLEYPLLVSFIDQC